MLHGVSVIFDYFGFFWSGNASIPSALVTNAFHSSMQYLLYISAAVEITKN